MAMQLKTITDKLLNRTLNLVRNHSRVSMPTMFWEDPFRRHRQLLSDFWNIPDAFEAMSPIQRYTGYRLPPLNTWEGERFASNSTDGFHVSMNVEHFAPNEINVKVIDKSILVEARHEERTENGESYVSRHFTRRYVLPDDFNVKDIVSTLSSDGILTVRVPPKEIDPQNVRNIHIQQTGSPARSVDQMKNPEQNRIPDPNENPAQNQKRSEPITVNKT